MKTIDIPVLIVGGGPMRHNYLREKNIQPHTKQKARQQQQTFIKEENKSCQLQMTSIKR